DLYVVDMVAVPQRLEYAVSETQNHDVLDGLLAEEMIHSIDLRFVQHLEDAGVQRASRAEIGPERFFDDHTPKAAVLFLGETNGPYLFDNRTEQLACDSQIENRVSAGPFDDVV